MRVVFSGQVPKDFTYPEACEDAFAVAPEIGRLAISDGASESYDSRTWAQMLVQKFISSPNLDEHWLSEAVVAYGTTVDFANLSWSRQSAYDRGSFATLLCLENYPSHNAVDILCVGDSLAILLNDGELHDSMPYQHAEQFSQRPELFSTKPNQNIFYHSREFFSQHHRTWQLEELSSPTILCMTDALGEWALRKAAEGEPQWQMLAQITDNASLEALVRNAREQKNMRIDDVTLLVVQFDEISNVLPKS